jgi:hypothetical protein
MPHYSDGTEAKIGDLVVGKPYNVGRVVAGEVVSVTPGTESCNLQVAFAEEVDPTTMYGAVAAYAHQKGIVGDQRRAFLSARTDYGETRAFTLIHREGMW